MDISDRHRCDLNSKKKYKNDLRIHCIYSICNDPHEYTKMLHNFNQFYGLLFQNINHILY